MQENTELLLSINERIIKILDYYGISRYKCSQETGISEAVLLNIYKGNNKPSLDVVVKLLNSYKVINTNWLIFGKGNMLTEKNISVIDKERPPDTCSNCFNLTERLKTTEKALKHAETALDLYERLKQKGKRESESAQDKGQKRKSA
jgi:transcriptional regulator with XRE-family HTH domain